MSFYTETGEMLVAISAQIGNDRSTHLLAISSAEDAVNQLDELFGWLECEKHFEVQSNSNEINKQIREAISQKLEDD